MKKMTSEEIINTYIDFFVEHGHLQVPSSSLIPCSYAYLETNVIQVASFAFPNAP